MPSDVEGLLMEQNLMEDYQARPEYQRNDYLGWIARAQEEDTRLRRISHMLDELAEGGVYMKMDHPPSSKSAD